MKRLDKIGFPIFVLFVRFFFFFFFFFFFVLFSKAIFQDFYCNLPLKYQSTTMVASCWETYTHDLQRLHGIPRTLVWFIHFSEILPENLSAPAVVKICVLFGPVCWPNVTRFEELASVDTVQISKNRRWLTGGYCIYLTIRISWTIFALNLNKSIFLL